MVRPPGKRLQRLAMLSGGERALTGVALLFAMLSVNPVPFGETARIVNLEPIRPKTVMALLISDADPMAADGASLLLNRLRQAGFPGGQVELNVARSTPTFAADHLAPLKSTPAARKAYWAPTDALLAALARSR